MSDTATLAADSLGPAGFGMGPQRIRLLPLYPADVKLDWDRETLEAGPKPRALRSVPRSIPEQYFHRSGARCPTE